MDKKLRASSCRLRNIVSKYIVMTAIVTAGTFFMLHSTLVIAQGSGSATADAQYTDGGTESCLRCHGGENMAVMAETAHGNANDPHAPYALQGCESCHGPGSLHVSRARGGTGFPALIRFGNEKSIPQQTSACLDCHGKDMGDIEGMEWIGSLHDMPNITCVSCHQMHTRDNPYVSREGEVEICSSCHQNEIKNHQRFESQGIVFDKLNCSDCHDVHQLDRKSE